MENVILDKIDDDVATRTCVVVVMPDKTYGVTYNKCDEAAVLSMFVVVTTLRNNVTMLINSEAMIVVVNVMIPIANEEIARSRRVIQCCSGRVGVSIWLALRRLIIVHTGIEGNDDLIPEVVEQSKRAARIFAKSQDKYTFIFIVTFIFICLST